MVSDEAGDTFWGVTRYTSLKWQIESLVILEPSTMRNGTEDRQDGVCK